MTKQLRNPDRMKPKQAAKPARKQQATKQEKRAARRPQKDDAPARTSAPRAARPSRSSGKPTQDAVAGRNPVVEALRAGVPATELIIASRAEMDERMMEALRLAKNANLAIKEVARGVLDIMTGILCSGSPTAMCSGFMLSASAKSIFARSSSGRSNRACPTSKSSFQPPRRPAWPNCAVICRDTSAKFIIRLTAGNLSTVLWV